MLKAQAFRGVLREDHPLTPDFVELYFLLLGFLGGFGGRAWQRAGGRCSEVTQRLLWGAWP